MSIIWTNLMKPSYSKLFSLTFRRGYANFSAEKCASPPSKGIILGIYADEDDVFDSGTLTPAGARYNEAATNGRLMELIRLAGPIPKRGDVRIFYDLEPTFKAVAVCGLGSDCLGYDSVEKLDESKEAIRRATATGCRELQKLETNFIYVEDMGHAESAAEGALMSVWINQDLKQPEKRKFVPHCQLYVERGLPCDGDGWRIGLIKADAQNLARQLQEAPANLMTPTMFAQNVVQLLANSGVNVEVKVKSWAEAQGMSSFLAVAKGSCQPPIFLELSYYGAGGKERPIVLIGQGNTFDSGGLCKKSCDEMQMMRGDMSGAACVVSTCRAIASMNLPVNIRGLIPLCEHIIGCNAVKPGDVIAMKNGKSIEVVNADLEGPLVLVDALLYAETFGPKYIVDVTTSSSRVDDSLGKVCSAVYTNSEQLWQRIKNAGVHTGDRVWRLPLWNYFTQQICSATHVDVQNVGRGVGGEPCFQAALLNEFLPCGQWMHIDANNVMTTKGVDYPYLRSGMAGRPTRTLIEFIARSVCKPSDPCALPSNQKLSENSKSV
ncbi:cytosol aminopeptidase-like [Toxorhynchites rutilus septentrionalis]|uniref:cytosol aminopeptidase-like n=1 Tax=Toxorhynchites rutilus septentrionalis TaxID=329112 RepID=UPI00247AF209|nr:cytosol aminopeptidase-like [Toxorhynchites rutilus septentrionalis]